MDTTSEIDWQGPFRIRSGMTAWSSAGDEAVVLDLQRSSYLGLNDTAALLWQQLLTPVSEAGLVDALTAEFDLPAPRARAEVRRFLTDLWERGYVEQG